MTRLRPSFASLMMLVAAFLALASHVGMFDHSTHLMSASAMSAAHAIGSGEPATVTQAMTHDPAMDTSSEPASPHRKSSDASMAMICQLLALVTIVGVGLRRLLFTKRQWAPHRPVGDHSRPTRSGRGLRPARPPGLTLLCVARC